MNYILWYHLLRVRRKYGLEINMNKTKGIRFSKDPKRIGNTEQVAEERLKEQDKRRKANWVIYCVVRAYVKRH